MSPNIYAQEEAFVAQDSEFVAQDDNSFEFNLINELNSKINNVNRRIDIIDELGAGIISVQESNDLLQAEISQAQQHLSSLEQQIESVNENIKQILSKVNTLNDKTLNSDNQIAIQSQSLLETNQRILQQDKRIDNIAQDTASYQEIMDSKLIESKQELEANLISLESLGAMLGGAIILLIITGGGLLLFKIRKGSTSIATVEEAQNSLNEAFIKLQEDSIKLDNEFLLIAQQKIQDIISQTHTSAEVSKSLSTTSSTEQAEPDHSLVLKLANEIARIETNLGKMSNEVKGYKQLVQSKDRMINNMKAYGYEIISLIGQEYDDGMLFEARFVPDPSLEEGRRVITGMVKMLVNFNGKMIQPAQIVVSQNL